jgi:hypothetical protein
MIGAARIETHKGRRLGFAVRCRDRVGWQHEALRGKKHQGGIAVMMRKRIVCVVVVSANGIRAAAILYIACERIGKVNVMMRMLDAIHDSDIRLRRQNEGERHAKKGDRSSKAF